MPITSVSHSSSLALTVVDANAHLRGLYDESDTHLQRLIEAATAWVEAKLGIYLLDCTVTETFDCWTDSVIRPTRGPVSSVTSVKYYDGDSAQQTWAASNYITTLSTAVRGGIEIAPDITQPLVDRRRYPWEVIYVAGFGSAETSVPENIQHALRLLVEDFDRNRGNMIIGTISSDVSVGVTRLLSVSEMGVL